MSSIVQDPRTASPLNLTSKYPPANRGRVILWGLLAAHPFGGMTWQALHHIVGLRRLGFDVWYVEDSDRYPYDIINYCQSPDYTGNVEYLARFMESVGLADRWIYRPPEQNEITLGACSISGLQQLYRDADVVLNLCGAQEWRPEFEHIRCRVFIETDPVANQVAVAQGDAERIETLDAYHHLFTYGANFGSPDCRVPIERYRWHTTRPPVCVDWWDTGALPPSEATLTTITNWEHSDAKDVIWNGERWRWNKNYSFLGLKNLPAMSALPLELSVGCMSDADIAMMQSCGWRLTSASDITGPELYRAYIQNSLGEFTATKEQVVISRSGWFSDRSVCYLAAGRPVITEDTGFGNDLPTGEGLFSFKTEADAIAAIEAVAGDYERHSAAARAIAREYFGAERVLDKLLCTVGVQ
jgi:hypothetical protein